MKIKIAFIFFCFIIQQNLFPKDQDYKFGKVTLKELQMKSYEKDPSAAAVVLYDIGSYDADNFVFTRNIRIKILNEQGYYLGNQIFPTRSKANIKAYTFNLDGDKIVKDKLSNDNFFTEKVYERRYNLRIAFPNVKKGTVIDLQYYHSGIPFTWKFQREIPVIKSILSMPHNPHFGVNKSFYGFEQIKQTKPYEWVADSLPAFKPEPFSNSVENYLTKFEFELRTINTLDLAVDWDDVALHLEMDRDYGDTFKRDLYLKDYAQRISDTCKTDDDKIRAAYREIKKLTWNKFHRLYTSHPDLSFTLKKGKGNSSDINLILMGLLRRLGFESYPFIISTRENGMLSFSHPMPSKINHTIVFLKHNNDTLFLDATEDYAPYYQTPLKDLNGIGVLLKKDKAEVIELKAKYPESKTILYNLSLNEDNKFTGQMNCVKQNYKATDFRKQYFKFNDDALFLNHYTEDKLGLVIKSFKLENLNNNYLPITENYQIELKNQIKKVDNQLYFLPLFYDRMDESPFKSPIRKYPIDFGCPIQHKVVVNITIPKNYQIIEIPKSVKFELSDHRGYFVYMVQKQNNQLRIQYKLDISTSLFMPEDYDLLKQFYHQIVIKHNEPIILELKS